MKLESLQWNSLYSLYYYIIDLDRSISCGLAACGDCFMLSTTDTNRVVYNCLFVLHELGDRNTHWRGRSEEGLPENKQKR